MIRQCAVCWQAKFCSYADRLPGFCCGDCWIDEYTEHSTKQLDGTPATPDDISPWQENVIRQLEDG
jgi:hypothetical protein